jgi:hypothetical protein
VGAVVVIVGDVITTDSPRMGFVQRDHVIEALAARAADPSFRYSVLPWTANGCAQRLNAGRFQQFHDLGAGDGDSRSLTTDSGT